MYLVDTNIFLEILLKQAKSQKCKDFLDKNISNFSMTDFSIHSIGVILLKQNEDALFLKFLNDMLPKVNLISLPKEHYKDIITNRKNKKLDSDDAYQYTVCRYHGFKLTTMDQDFKNIKDLDVLFL